MIKQINALTAVFLVLILVFTAVACTHGFADAEITKEEYSDESAAVNALPTDIADTDVTEEACIPALEIFETTKKSTKANKKAATTIIDNYNEQTSEKEDVLTETDNVAIKDSIGAMTLEINEVGDGWFTACHPFPSQLKYKVIYDLGEEFNSGDIIEVKYNTDEFDSEASPVVLRALSVTKGDYKLEPSVTYKPVIYLYPEGKIEVSVKVNYNGKLTYTIPDYRSGWNVTAYPDGRIVNFDGKQYPYLFWEGVGESDYDLSEGFCVKGSDAEKFLCDKLSLMGLSKSEIDDFNEFWVPFLKRNPYNRICFQTTAYTDNAELVISPKPDSMLRVFMVYTPLDTPMIIKSQTINAFERTGFSVVEWGGAVVY